MQDLPVSPGSCSSVTTPPDLAEVMQTIGDVLSMDETEELVDEVGWHEEL